jgi:hypothetical protein
VVLRADVPTAAYLAFGQLSFGFVMHAGLSILLPLEKSRRSMLLAEDLLKLLGVLFCTVLVPTGDGREDVNPHHVQNSSNIWALLACLAVGIALFYASRTLVPRLLLRLGRRHLRVGGGGGMSMFSSVPWSMPLSRLEFFTDGVFVITICLVLVEMVPLVSHKLLLHPDAVEEFCIGQLAVHAAEEHDHVGSAHRLLPQTEVAGPHDKKPDDPDGHGPSGGAEPHPHEGSGDDHNHGLSFHFACSSWCTLNASAIGAFRLLAWQPLYSNSERRQCTLARLTAA